MIRKTKGFTLTELMIVILVLAVVVVYALPSFTNLLHKQKLNSDFRSLTTTLHQVRSQAVFLRKNIELKFVSGSNDETHFFWQGYSLHTLTSQPVVASVIFQKDGALNGATADINFKLCNQKLNKTKNFTLTKSGSIVYKADGTC
jgi:type IV fimbrial biogenesis protein FimT